MKYTQEEREPLIVQESALAEASPVANVARVMRGLPVGEFDALRAMLGLTVEEMSQIIGISVATLSRRRTSGQPLDRDHSDRLMRYARLYWLAASLFDGCGKTAREWLRRPARSLGGSTPLAFAETEIGAREVEHLLGRLEYGVYV